MQPLLEVHILMFKQGRESIEVTPATRVQKPELETLGLPKPYTL